MLRFFLLTLGCLSFPMRPAVMAQEPAAAENPPDVGLRVESQHRGTFGGSTFDYLARAEEVVLRDDAGKPEAGIFCVAYLRQGVDSAQRPVTFLWNGGPGSSSVWLHMGAYGPWRVDVPSDARDDGGPPYSLVPNPDTFLDLSDIVFVDPVGTGFSRPLGEKTGKDFYGVAQDARAMARFIRQWLSQNQRWNSPKFLGGESYGTTRAAAVVRELEGGYNDVSLNGILLISTILDFTIENHSPGNELPNAMHLPTMAATARYHGKAGQNLALEDFVREAREYALGDYTLALMQGQALPAAQAEKVRDRLAYFTGLDPQYIENSNLRLRPWQFQKELLRDRGLSVGRLDSRYAGEDLDRVGDSPDTDPSFYGIDGAYTAAINQHLRANLLWTGSRQYNIIGLGEAWDWKLPSGSKDYLSVAPYVNKALRQNRHLHVFVAQGYYDFATPFLAAEFSLNRPGMVLDRIHFAYYESGHMMYVHHPSLDKLLADTRAFLQTALQRDGNRDDDAQKQGALDPEQVRRGKELFVRNACITCHGETGRGNGAAAPALPVPPRDYTDPHWQNQTSDATIQAVIREGGAAHGLNPIMVAYPNFTDEELQHLTQFIRSLGAPK